MVPGLYTFTAAADWSLDTKQWLASAHKEAKKPDCQPGKTTGPPDSDAKTFMYRLRACNVPDENKISIALLYFSEKLIWDYWLELTKGFQEISKQTGRDIKYEHEKYYGGSETRTTMWLDRGKLDSPECTWSATNRYPACDYPAGFEEYKVGFTSFNDTCCASCVQEHIIFTYDDAEKIPVMKQN